MWKAFAPQNPCEYFNNKGLGSAECPLGDLELLLSSVLAILWLEATLSSLLPWVGPVQPQAGQISQQPYWVKGWSDLSFLRLGPAPISSPWPPGRAPGLIPPHPPQLDWRRGNDLVNFPSPDGQTRVNRFWFLRASFPRLGKVRYLFG